MKREDVLEDVLRGRAAEVAVDPGALAAILGAAPPSGRNNQQRPDRTPPQPTPSPAASPGGIPGAAPNGAGGAAPSSAPSGGSFLGRLARFVAWGMASVVVAAVVGVGIAGATGDHCPVLELVEPEVNDVVKEHAGDRSVSIPCEVRNPPWDYGDVESQIDDETVRVQLRNDREEIEKWIGCINEASTPLSLGSFFDNIPDACARRLVAELF